MDEKKDLFDRLMAFPLFKPFAPLCLKYKEVLLYGFWGGIVTLVNIAVYTVLAEVLSVNYMAANVAAWVIGFLVAYVSNKLWVFNSKSWEPSVAVKEFFQFFTARFATGLLDMFLMWLFVSVLGWYGPVAKIVDNVVVIIANYIASKFWIFHK